MMSQAFLKKEVTPNAVPDSVTSRPSVDSDSATGIELDAILDERSYTDTDVVQILR